MPNRKLKAKDWRELVNPEMSDKVLAWLQSRRTVPAGGQSTQKLAVSANCPITSSHQQLKDSMATQWATRYTEKQKAPTGLRWILRKRHQPPLFEPKDTPAIANQLSRWIVRLSFNSAVCVVAFRHLFHYNFYDLNVGKLSHDIEAKLMMVDLRSSLKMSPSKEWLETLNSSQFEHLASLFFEWYYDRLPVLLVGKRFDGKVLNPAEIDFLSTWCFIEGVHEIPAFNDRQLAWPGWYGTMTNLVRGERVDLNDLRGRFSLDLRIDPGWQKLTNAPTGLIYDHTWLRTAIEECFPGGVRTSNQELFAMQTIAKFYPKLLSSLEKKWTEATILYLNVGFGGEKVAESIKKARG